ncbi:heavy metal-transporting ATPase [Weissella oryzae SG25]|uniref:Cd(2+)-exporting ATPase n=1 Tax=Weissella oryzae (strain DSM 25784 / JCM 18191 / LMG 30913 / SG25) TaxID=1329250 RepID=A0A069CRC1_WEIOS|nr:heavy metal translocating P-type ATPase [Weissella oryzae]GAK29919.1 heavy metal-transporting ATPase [Weissella oryzae SG25]
MLQKFMLKHNGQVVTALAIMLGLAWGTHLMAWFEISTTLLVIAAIFGFVPVAIKAYQALRFGVIAIELLVTIAVIGAMVIGEYEEAAMVTFLFLFGSFLEKKTLERTRQSIKQLTNLAPKTAVRELANGSAEIVDIDQVAVNDLLIVKTGSQIPVDGIVSKGGAYVNEASITGEAMPVHKQIGDTVFMGSIVENGTLRITAKQVGEDTTFGKIIEMVETAQDSKSSVENFIDSFAKYYTPAILVIALVVGLVSRNLGLAITMLVLACPGALVIGAPVSMVAAIGNGAKHGILIKGAETINTLAQVDTMLFNKTGTLTQGQPSVVNVKSYDFNLATQEKLVAIEKESNHPLAKAIVNYLKIASQVVIETTEVRMGQGIVSRIAGETWLVGNQQLLAAHEVQLTEAMQADLLTFQKAGMSTVLFADDHVRAIFAITDKLRPNVTASLDSLKRQGIKQLVMLTGDSQKTGQMLASQLPLDRFEADLLPTAKAEIVKRLQKSGRKVAFIGDGINDSPALTLADIGIAMGSGTDVAIETSDVVLINADFASLKHAYGLAKKAQKNVVENIIIAVLTVIFLFIMLFFGYIHMASGMFVHEASILIVIVNAMRLTYFKVG